MKLSILFLLVIVGANSCNKPTKVGSLPIAGTWQLVAATSTAKDSTVTTFNPGVKMIKIITATHFAFLSHNISTGKDSLANAFSAGGGTYSLQDSTYTEHLEYYIDKQWENNSFSFVIKIAGDTLVQSGVEKNEKVGVDHVIVEKYKRIGR